LTKSDDERADEIRSLWHANNFDHVSTFTFFSVSLSVDIFKNQDSMMRLTAVQESRDLWDKLNRMIRTFLLLQTTLLQSISKWLASSDVNIAEMMQCTNSFVSSSRSLTLFYHSVKCLCISIKITIQFSASSSSNDTLSWIMFRSRFVNSNCKIFWSMCRNSILSLICAFLM
jgi:hypothetical protein